MRVLKGIPREISPEIMKCLMEMGHGDEIAIVDGNFPAHSFERRVVRLDGLGVSEVLKAVIRFFPLDTFVEENVFLMDNGSDEKPSIWKDFEEILKESGEDYRIGYLERFEFYDRVKKSFCIVATSETALYANIILKKGVVVV